MAKSNLDQFSAEDAFQGSAFAELELKVRPEVRACELGSVFLHAVCYKMF